MSTRRWLLWIAAVPLVLAALGLAGFQVAVHQLRAGILQALGPRVTVGALKVDWHSVEMLDMLLRAEGPGWPAQDELRAARIKVVPELRSVLSGSWRVRSVEIEGGYVSVLRTRQGRLRVLPAWLEQAQGDAAPGLPPPVSGSSASSPVTADMPPILIQAVRLQGAQVEFFDASVTRPPHRLLLDRLDTTLGPLALPTLDKPVGIALAAVLKGPRHDGTLSIQGQFTPATRDAQLAARLQGVDLIALQPYLLRLNEGGVRQGTLDLSVDATVAGHHLRAPGVMTLVGLELGDGGGVWGTFAGVPRRAVLAAMSRDGRIALRFTLDGRLDDPRFSLNEQLATRTAAGLAEALGVSLGGMVEGVGNMIKGLFGR